MTYGIRFTKHLNEDLSRGFTCWGDIASRGGLYKNVSATELCEYLSSFETYDSEQFGKVYDFTATAESKNLVLVENSNNSVCLKKYQDAWYEVDMENHGGNLACFEGSLEEIKGLISEFNQDECFLLSHEHELCSSISAIKLATSNVVEKTEDYVLFIISE